MLNKLVIENLKDRWVRTLLAALVVAVQVMSILVLMGLSRGLLQQSAERARGSGADIFLTPDTQGTISFSTGQIDAKYVPFVSKQPHVTEAVGVLSASVSGELFTRLNGVDFPAFARLNGGFRYLQGGPPAAPDDLVVDEAYAKEHKLHVGETIRLINHNWHLAGVIRGGVLGRLIVPLTTLQQLTGNYTPPRLSEILVKVDNPALVNQVVAQLGDKLKGVLRASSLADFLDQFRVDNIPALRSFIAVITGLAVVVGFLVVFLSMYTSVVERTREIGILKALGAKPVTIMEILIREAVLLAVAGCILGIALFFIAQGVVTQIVPASLTVVNVPDWYPIAGGIALVGAILGAIYPGLKAARQDAIEALAYE